MIDIAGVNRSSPAKEPSSPPSNGLRRERSRRDAIQPSNNPINSPKGKDKTKSNRKKKVSKVTSAEKITEEPNEITGADEGINLNDIQCNVKNRCPRRSLPAIEHDDNDRLLCPKSEKHSFLNNEHSQQNGSRKSTRSISETKPPLYHAISPSNRHRNVIHCDNELLRYQPKKLSANDQKIRRKMTSVANFYGAPLEMNSIA